MTNNRLVLISSLLGSIVSICALTACSDSKSAQCQKIYAIAEDLASETQDLSQIKEIKDEDLDRWLAGAEKIEEAATKMEKLSLEDTQLTAYKGEWVEFQRNYALATQEMVQARRDRDLTAANYAIETVKQAGKLEKELVDRINSYCQEK